MWLFPVLSVLTALGIVASWSRWRSTPTSAPSSCSACCRGASCWSSSSSTGTSWAVGPTVDATPPTGDAHRVLVLANETVRSAELLDELRRIDAAGAATYFVCVPASPVETGQATVNGPLQVWDATAAAAEARLADTLATLRSEDLDADGALGDYRPLRALTEAVESFGPDQIVIATRPLADSVWQRYDVVDRARSAWSIPVTHVVAASVLSTD